MNSPITALAWDIWRRGKRLAWLAIGCVALCAFINEVLIDRLHLSSVAHEIFFTLFRMLMVLSFFLLMGIFNYTEYNSTREWNGFPYRLFTLPVATWKLVTLPLFLCVSFTELIFFAWVKLVWNHELIPLTGWFAIVLGASVIFYQTILWCFAGFRILRIVALGFGGVSAFAVAIMPFFATLFGWSWPTEGRLIAIIIALTAGAYTIALTTIARQRCGGGRRQSRIMALTNCLMDALPKRTGDFASPAAAQFWFEWRRAGWLLPGCVLLVIALATPIAWYKRNDPAFTSYLLGRLLIAPILLSFMVGKGFVQCEFWSTSLGVPNFLAVRPLAAVEFVGAKMKVAAVSVIMAWLFVLAFLVLWLSLWANADDLKMELFSYRVLNPHSWMVTGVLSGMSLMIFSWRLMIGGLWMGLTGNRTWFLVWSTLQIVVPVLGLLAVGIWSDTIDREIRTNPMFMQSLAINGLGWCLAALVIAKYWMAVFTWSGVDHIFRRRYFLVWVGGLACLLALAFLVSPLFDTYRLKHLFLLAALLGFPLARCGLAPRSWARNRHR